MRRQSNNMLVMPAERPVGSHSWSQCEYHLLQLLTSGPLLPTREQLCQPSLRSTFSVAAVEKALVNLKRQKWIYRYAVPLCQARLPESPYLVCQPDEGCPDFRQLKMQVKLQGRLAPVWRRVNVFIPSRQAANIFGMPRSDIGRAETHAYRLAISQAASLGAAAAEAVFQGWIWDRHKNFQPHERALGIRLESTDRSTRAAGIIQAQSYRSLERLHAHCAEQNWPIELW